MRSLLAPDVPFDPRRVPFFYGWIVTAAATAGVLFSLPGQTMGVSVFTDSLLDATSLDRLAFSNAYLLGTLGSAALLPRTGRLIDRLGVRAAALAAALGLGAVLALLSQADRLARPLASTLPGLGASAAFLLLTLLFVGLRFSGQGVLTLASRTMLASWFDRRRGLVTAIHATFVAFGFAYAPRVFDAWIERAGWRGAWLEMAVTVIVGMAVVAFLFFRETPESCGLAMDGDRPRSGREKREAREPFSTRAEALGTRAFWVLTLGLALQGLVITGITLHVVDLGAEGGLDRSAAVSFFLPLAVTSTAGGALVGWLADRVSIGSLVRSLLAFETIGFAASAHLGHPLGFWGAALALGLAGGLYQVLSSVAHPRFFGRLHLGAIAGASMSIVVVGSALGPSALALSRSAFDSYAPGLYATACLPALLVLFSWKPLHPRDVPAKTSSSVSAATSPARRSPASD